MKDCTAASTWPRTSDRQSDTPPDALEEIRRDFGYPDLRLGGTQTLPVDERRVVPEAVGRTAQTLLGTGQDFLVRQRVEWIDAHYVAGPGSNLRTER